MTHRPHSSLAHAAIHAGAPFWVVGGEYRDTNFSEMSGPAEALGPFKHYDEALALWRTRSVDSRPEAHVRYSIVGRASR